MKQTETYEPEIAIQHTNVTFPVVPYKPKTEGKNITMSTFQLDPTAKDFPVLRSAGEYGPGRQHEADCEITEFEIPAEEGPGYDRACERGQYAFFKVVVRSEEFGMVTLFHHETIGSNSGSKVEPWLAALGLCDSTLNIDVANVPGTKCGVEVTDPRQAKNDPEKWYNGRIKSIFAV